EIGPDGDRSLEQVRLGERDLVVLRLRALLQRHADRLTAAQEVRRLERELPEEAVELRHAGAEGELVAVLLLEPQRDVDLVVGARRLHDVHLAFLALERLEVAELVEPADAFLERLRVEQAAFGHARSEERRVGKKCRAWREPET